MNLVKIPVEKLKVMEKKGFIELTPYIHKNPLVRWLFWKRFETALKLSKKGFKRMENKKVLDFGSGSGIFLPTLSNNFEEVCSLDLDTRALNFVKKEYGLKNVKIFRSKGESIQFKDNYFDVIFATDVLEHFKNSKNIQREFNRILKKEGVLIVSGPTENFLYRLGRKFLYKRQKPIDHYTNVEEILSISKSFFEVEKVVILPTFFIPAFKLYSARKLEQYG